MIELIKCRPGVKRMELATLLGVSVKTIGRYLAACRDKVVLIGSDRTGGYYLK